MKYAVTGGVVHTDADIEKKLIEKNDDTERNNELEISETKNVKEISNDVEKNEDTASKELEPYPDRLL
jgi:hypothetical protein